MKRILAITLALSLLLAGCSAAGSQEPSAAPTEETTAATETRPLVEEPQADCQIVLSDEGITVDGEAVSTDSAAAVYVANDIVYYEEGHDFTYGEGTESDAHSADEAGAHTVVHITQPGTYCLTGSLSAGQVAVDLGDEAQEDPNAVVTLVLNNVDITCSVAPAVIFYNVYECGSADTETASQTVDTTTAGANVFLADGSVNNITGSYVARIYKPDSVELSEDGTEVADAKKLHKYDAAFYSKKTMNVDGNDGILNITADNEGLDSELHLTISGGEINIVSGNDGINTNEDGVSVTTINGGRVNIVVSGETGEGDGIDSNGYLVINGGTVTAAACSNSQDAGIDSDMGIYINGGTVLASGHMLDRISGGSQTYAVFTFAETQSGGTTYTLKNSDGNPILNHTPANDFSVLIIAGSGLAAGDYTFWQGATQLSATSGQGFGGGMMGGQRPDGEMPEDMELPEGEMPADMGQRPEMPEGGERTPPEGMQDREMPEGMEKPDGEMAQGEMPTMPEGQMPEGEMPQGGFGGGRGGRGQMGGGMGEVSTTFTIVAGGNYFSNVTAAEE